MHLKYSENFRSCQITWQNRESPELGLSGAAIPRGLVMLGGIEDGESGLITVAPGLSLRPSKSFNPGGQRRIEVDNPWFEPVPIGERLQSGVVNLSVGNLVGGVSVTVESMNILLMPSAEATVHWRPSAGNSADMSFAPEAYWVIDITSDCNAFFKVSGEDDKYFSTKDVLAGIAAKFDVVPTRAELFHGEDSGNPSILSFTKEEGAEVVDLSEGDLLLRDVASPNHGRTRPPLANDPGHSFDQL